MVQLEPAFEPHLLEEEARSLWKSRRLPPAGGLLGTRDGPVVRQFEGTFTLGEPPGVVAQRAVAADVDGRYLALAGRRAQGTLRGEVGTPDRPVPPTALVLERLGVWTGGDGTMPWDRANRHDRVEMLLGNLAHHGVVVSRDLPLRACPSCGEPRSPERIIYQEAEGDTYLVRFDLTHEGRSIHALVWVDAPWRLLGTSALLVHPELPYVIAKYRRKELEELVLTSRSSLERFRSWLPGATFEVIEEHPGRFFEGRVYDYPLRHEFPTGGALAPPGGTILAVPDVTDSGTGIVPLVPGHGSTDAAIAEARGVSGWPLVTPRGLLDLTLMHKYAGLDLRTGSEFIVRDLTESDAIFAHLRVRRGVPHCAVCGSPLVWIPGRAWCLEPSRLPPDRLDLYARLLPDAPPLSQIEVAPWPLSGTLRSDEPNAVALLECSRCERLEALRGPVACPCGGRRYPVRRLLVSSAAGALEAWARFDPFPFADSVHLYVGERRRVPAVVHHLMAMAGLEGAVGDVSLTVLPTVSDGNLPELIDSTGADAVRAALVRAATPEGAAGPLGEHCRVELDRLARLWAAARDVVQRCDPGMLSSFLQPVGGFVGELEPEDRAILARWERTRVLALADYDRWSPASVHRRVIRFLETDLSEYREWVGPRLGLAGSPPVKRAALRTLVHILRHVAIVLGPITPHTSEVIHRRFGTERTSLFEGALVPVDRTLLNDELFAAWDRWRSVVHAVAQFRRASGSPPESVVPSAAILLEQDESGDKFRSDRPVLERLARIARLEVGSPREPWQGRQRQIRPVESEIQRVYPSQATQVVHLLNRSPPRKTQESGPASELSVVIQGNSIRIFPSMVEYVETLPSGVLPHPWAYGEMYLELPRGGRAPDRVPPPLSSDALWLVRRLKRSLRRKGPAEPGRPRVAVIATAEPLASELRGQSEALARYLGLSEVRVPEAIEASPPATRLRGRTRTGVPWWVDVPGLDRPRLRTKHRMLRAKNRRFPAEPVLSGPPEVDYGDDEQVARWQAVRTLGTELDGLMEAPLLGPTKVSRAWEHGLTSLDAYRSASFDTLISLPGFDHAIASRLIEKLGGKAPPTPARRVPPPTPARKASNEDRVLPPRPVTRIPPTPAIPPPAPRATPDEQPARVVPADQAVPTARPSPEILTADSSRPTGTSPETSDTEDPSSGVLVPIAPLVEGSGTQPQSIETPPEERATLESPQDSPTSEILSTEITTPAEPLVTEMTAESAPGPTPEPAVPATLPVPEVIASSIEVTPPIDVEPTPLEIVEPKNLPESVPETAALAQPPTVHLELGADAVPGTDPPASPSGVLSVEDVARPAEATATPEAEVPGGPVEEPAPDLGTTSDVAGVLTTPETESPTLEHAEEGEGSAESEPPPQGVPTETTAPPSTEPSPEPRAESPVPTSPPGGIELEIGVSLLSSIQPFLDATAAGHRGICVVRESPERVSAQVGSRPVDVYWLTNLGRGKTLKPNDLPGMFAFLSHAVGEERITVFFLEGIEYLIRIHGVQAVIERLLEFDLEAKAQDARIWVHLTSDLLRANDLERIVASLGPAVDPVPPFPAGA